MAAPKNSASDLPAANPRQTSPAVPQKKSSAAIDATEKLAPAISHEQHATESTSTPSQPALHYRTDLPPSAELIYDVRGMKKGVSFFGKSTLNWKSDGSQYSINGITSIEESATRSFDSVGTIDHFGLAPLLYTEKSHHKSQTNTHFQRERNLISFSSSTASYPRQGGEQDRASVVLQLAAIARGDIGKLTPGTAIDIFVAGVRDGDTWRFRVIGEEKIDIGSADIAAWHFVRLPRSDSYDQRIDIWLDPQRAWYPVMVQYTQTNGDLLIMSLTNLHSVTNH